MIEQERKFLLKYLPQDFKISQEIKQGYLMLDDKNQLRVRIINETNGFLTYKNSVSSILKKEFEYEIPISDAIELFSLCPYRLEKKRIKTTFEGNTVDIDVYPDGLQIVEIEFDNELTSLPAYCGKDVSDDKKYSNVEIAKRNSCL